MEYKTVSEVIIGLTKIQKRQVEQFLHLFSDIEATLKKKLRLKPNDSTAVSELIKRYRKTNPFWSESAHELWLLSDIRNLLTHNRSTTHGYPDNSQCRECY